MTIRTTMRRTIRLAIGAAAVLALIPPAAQARPALMGGGAPVPQQGRHAPILTSPAGHVWLAHENGSVTVAKGLPATRQALIHKADSGDFAWGAAAIGAGSALAAGVLGAAAVATVRRRRVPLST